MVDKKKMYVTEEEGKALSFPYDWHQTWHHPFEMNRVVNEAQTIKAFVADGDERQMGLEVLKLLLDYTFATRDQLVRLLSIKGLDNGDRLDALLQKYQDRRLINKFAISAFEMDHIPDDAFVVYCLDHASRHILSHMYRDDVAVTWKSTNAVRGPELVAKYLATNEFYLSLLAAKTQSLAYFEPTVNFTIRSRDIRVSAIFRIMNGATPCDFVLEVVRASDIPSNWRKKTNEQLAPFVLDKFWNRYFQIEPIFIFLAEDLQQAKELAEIYYLRTESNNFRVTTDSELCNGIDKAKFYKYEPNSPEKLVVSSAKIFQKD